MKIKTSDFIKNLADKNTELTIGKAIANILIGAKEGGKMKLFILAQKFYQDDEVEIDGADLSLIKKSIESAEVYSVLVTGQLLLVLDSLKKE